MLHTHWGSCQVLETWRRHRMGSSRRSVPRTASPNETERAAPTARVAPTGWPRRPHSNANAGVRPLTRVSTSTPPASSSPPPRR